MKTATITLYHIYGTRCGISADVTYRGKLIYSIQGNEPEQKLCDMARKWAHNAGFTHTKIILN